MKNKERKLARRYDTPNRCYAVTSTVYSGPAEDRAKKYKEAMDHEKDFYPEKSKYNIYIGDIHGHSQLSDGFPDADTYYKDIRDNEKLDFCSLTDHDHGGVGADELFGEKWEIEKAKAREYNNPGKFTTILGYERDSYPWYNNMVIYYNSYDGEMVRSDFDGEISRADLLKTLNRDDVIVVPHDTYNLTAGADFNTIPPELFTPLIEIYSRGDSAEYFGNPCNIEVFRCEGGFWQDALKRGAKMGCIGGSDNHARGDKDYEKNYKGIDIFGGRTGVLAEENTLSSIFSALKARRCYGFMGGKMWIDFRINGHYMGEEFADDSDRSIYINVKADAPVKMITIVKNCRNYIESRNQEFMVFDYKAENETDYYYIRVELTDGRFGWTSPIWISKK